jgi:hypothetical protein
MVQDLLNDNNSNVKLGEKYDGKMDNPKCEFPASEKGKSILVANMSTCDTSATVNPINVSCEPSTATTTSQKTTSATPTSTMSTTLTSPIPATPTSPVPITPTIPMPTDKVQCFSWSIEQNARKVLLNFPYNYDYMADLVLPTRIPNFEISEVYDNGQGKQTTIKVETGIREEDKDFKRKTLVYSCDSETKCYKNVYGTGYITAKRNTSYTFCMMDDNQHYTAPTHCLAITTIPEWSGRAWISNSMRKFIIPVLTILLMFCLLLGALLVIITFWKKPTLLKKISDRVEVVRTSGHDAIVMPVSATTNNDNRPSMDSGGSEDPSYISLAPVSNISLFVFRFREWLRRVRTGEEPEQENTQNGTTRRMEEQPPLPEHQTGSYIISRNSDI